MGLNSAAAIAEILAAVGVLVSVLYLAHQIKQNTAVARSAARQAITHAAMGGAQSLAENADLAELMYRSLAGKPMEPHETFRLQVYCYLTLRQYENIHYQFTAGMLNAGEWKGFRENLSLFFITDLFETYWKQDERLFSPAFAELLQTVRSELRAEGKLGTESAAVLMPHGGVSVRRHR